METYNGLKVEMVNIRDIKPYAKNAKMHPQEQIEQIKKSIENFGFNDPVATWHGKCVCGHGRLLAAKELNIDTIPVIRLDHLTDEQRRAYALVHNKLTMNSPFDDGILSEELENILDIDMSMFDLGEYIDTDLPTEPKEVSISDNYCIIVECENEEELERTFQQLQDGGYKCRISTL